MTTKRTPIRRNARVRITPEIVALWRRLEEIKAAGGDEEWEPVRQRREFSDTHLTLHRALGLRPWEANPFDVDDGPRPPYQTCYSGSWEQTQELRRVILAEIEAEVVGQRGRVAG